MLNNMKYHHYNNHYKYNAPNNVKYHFQTFPYLFSVINMLAKCGEIYIYMILTGNYGGEIELYP